MKKKLSTLLAVVLVVLLSLFAAPGEEAAIPPQTEAQLQTIAESTLPETQATVPPDTAANSEAESEVLPDIFGTYTTKEDVALYIHIYGCLPENFITKAEAKALGWYGGSLERCAPGMCIGGDSFGNYEGLLPEGREYIECDIDTLGAEKRGAKRIVYSEDGLIYYTEDHYESFELLYGEP